MKKKDLEHLESVCALYTLCHCMDDMFDGFTEDDFPEMLSDSIHALKASIHDMIESMEQYHALKKDTFMSACEDFKTN